MGNVNVRCLLDTGAEVSTITETFYKTNLKGKAGVRLEHEALQRQKGRNAKSTTCDIPLGGRVYIKNHHQGRHKMQVVWNPKPYRVVAKPNSDGHVYTLELMDGDGFQKNVHRSEILDSKDIVVTETVPTVIPVEVSSDIQCDDHPQDMDIPILNAVAQALNSPDPSRMHELEIENANDENLLSPLPLDEVVDMISAPVSFSSGTDNEVEEDVVIIVQPPADRREETPPSLVTTLAQPQPQRYSTRSGAGQHSNPHRLPVSTVVQERAAVSTSASSPHAQAISDLAQNQVLLAQLLLQGPQ
ncbi:uncharacterized protein LOC121368521 [Gigantopelta aegis]|uniref:uncharacterized protein LOC121368521 n=1 Tax=Gigantopelta aegis TaxID=1735272 RepID=UPI001B888411|nr:uncharacterized protein LOC121368521 [Gigantopelta aegis]